MIICLRYCRIKQTLTQYVQHMVSALESLYLYNASFYLNFLISDWSSVETCVLKYHSVIPIWKILIRPSGVPMLNKPEGLDASWHEEAQGAFFQKNRVSSRKAK